MPTAAAATLPIVLAPTPVAGVVVPLPAPLAAPEAAPAAAPVAAPAAARLPDPLAPTSDDLRSSCFLAGPVLAAAAAAAAAAA
jgi:hypothetical protein